jgi:hypothetical protein
LTVAFSVAELSVIADAGWVTALGDLGITVNV